MHWFERKYHAGRIIWSRLTMDHLSPVACSMYNFQADPSTVIVILHCPCPKLSGPSWIIQKTQFWRQAFGSAPCSVTHLLVSARDSKCPFYRSGLWKCTCCISQLTTHSLLQPFLPSFLFASVLHMHATLGSLQ